MKTNSGLYLQYKYISTYLYRHWPSKVSLIFFLLAQIPSSSFNFNGLASIKVPSIQGFVTDIKIHGRDLFTNFICPILLPR